MKKMLKATHEFFYGGKTHKAGDEFEAVDPDANILVVTGKAEEVFKAAAPKRQAAPEPAPKLEAKVELPVADPKDGAPQKKRRYLRRDMQAGD